MFEKNYPSGVWLGGFFVGKYDEKSPFQGKKCGFDVANAHKFLKISD